jgi:hypothetical protein
MFKAKDLGIVITCRIVKYQEDASANCSFQPSDSLYASHQLVHVRPNYTTKPPSSINTADVSPRGLEAEGTGDVKLPRIQEHAQLRLLLRFEHPRQKNNVRRDPGSLLLSTNRESACLGHR